MKTEKTGWITQACQRKVSRVLNKLIESEIEGQNNCKIKLRVISFT